MGGCDDVINFDLSEEWEVVASVTKTAELIGENSHTPIPQISLDVNLTNTYVAVFATSTIDVKATWRYAGEIRQVYNFAAGGGSAALNKIQTEPTPLFINKLQVVEAKRVSDVPFDLRYQPPPWFKDCGVRVWRYTGERKNFVRDTLFDIGNQLGIGTTEVGENPILIAVGELKAEVEECCNYFENEMLTLKQGLATDLNKVFVELQQLKAVITQGFNETNLPQEQLYTSYFTGLL